MALTVLLLLVVFQKDWIILGPVVLVLKGNLSSAENSGVSEERAVGRRLITCLNACQDYLCLCFLFCQMVRDVRLL